MMNTRDDLMTREEIGFLETLTMFISASYFIGIRHMHRSTGGHLRDRLDQNARTRNIVEAIIAGLPVALWVSKSFL